MDAFAKRQQLKPALHLLEVMVEDLGIKRPKEKWVKWLRIMMERKGLSHPLVPPVRSLVASMVSILLRVFTTKAVGISFMYGTSK